MVRNKPLLMVHSLEPKGDTVKGPIARFRHELPYGDYSTTINVVVKQVCSSRCRAMSTIRTTRRITMLSRPLGTRLLFRS
jgi:hypothetical protein